MSSVCVQHWHPDFSADQRPSLSSGTLYIVILFSIRPARPKHAHALSPVRFALLSKRGPLIHY